MRNLIVLLLILSFYSCDSDDNSSLEPEINQEYLDQLLGFYELKAIYINNPIDLNGDGISGTDIFEEVEYCNMSKLLETYWCTIVDRGSYQKIHFDAPISDWSNVEQSFTHCLRHQRLSSDIIILSVQENVKLNTQDYQADFMFDEHRTKILDFRWDNRVIYLTLEQQLMTPADEWETVIMNIEYEWVRSET